MNDPKSYDHVETKCFDMGDHLVVTTTYRGKNAFGGVVKNWIKAKTDLSVNGIISKLKRVLSNSGVTDRE